MDADELDARVTFTELRLCDIGRDKIENNDILGEINLIKLRELIQNLGKLMTRSCMCSSSLKTKTRTSVRWQYWLLTIR